MDLTIIFSSLKWEKGLLTQGSTFYAVDLRRYGRSREPWQYPFNIRNQEEYFADIDSAILQIKNDGNTDITLGGHSTGGLTVALFGAVRGTEAGVDRIVTDSPFLEWNYSSFMRNIAIPTVGFFRPAFQECQDTSKPLRWLRI